MTTDKTEDWRKQAAAMAATDEDVERAFFDQAYTHIENKAGPIMRSPYRVGFEIVFKNDDNTRMTGIFIFRVNKRLFYAPVFFINGQIKGTDLFYDHDQRQFVLLNERWVKYLMSMANENDGRGISRSYRRDTRDQLDLWRVAEPPESRSRTTKVSAETDSDFPAMPTADELRAELDGIEFPKEAEESLLKRFIVEHGSWDARRKIAATARQNFDFARALFSLPAENYAPELDHQLKQADARRPVLELHTGILQNDRVKQANETDLARGYKFEDHRKEAAVNVQVYSDNTNFQTIDEPGIYDVLVEDGSTRRMLVGYYFRRDHIRHPSDNNDLYDHDFKESDDPKPIDFAIIDLNNRQSDDGISGKRRPLGELIRYDLPDEIKRSEPQEGTTYRIYNAHDCSLSCPFYVIRVNRDETGMIQAFFCREFMDEVSAKPLRVNPDYDGCDYDEQICGKGCYFIEVAGGPRGGSSPGINYPHDLRLGRTDALNKAIYEHGYKRASVRMIPGEGYQVRTEDGAKYANVMGELGTKAYLMAKCAVTESVADDILAQAAEHKKSAFFYDPMEKSGYNISFSDWPNFEETVNPDYGVLEQPRSYEIVETQQDDPHIERHRIGDAYQMEGHPDSISTKTPMELQQIAQQSGMSSLFEHGVVGELTNTYDAVSMYEQYIPDLMQGLDRLARMLFLYYWKPEDMVAAYGSDDQTQMENHLLSTFKSYGNLVLDLKLKTRRYREGGNEFS